MEKEKIILEKDEELSLNQRMFFERENHCPLCNSQLNIRIRSYLENFTVAEEAACAHCELVVRTKDHKMN